MEKNAREKTIALLQDYYNSFNKKDMKSFLACLDKNVIHDINHGGQEIGQDVFAKFMDRMNTYYQEQLTDLVIMASEDGTRGSCEYVVHGKYVATDSGLPAAKGQTYKLPGGAFFEITNGKIKRVTNYYNLNNWLKQI